MLFGIGAAASAIDLLKSLTTSKPANGSGKPSGFDPTSSQASTSSTASLGAPSQSSGLSPQTMSALLDAQGSATMTSPASSRSKALQNLFAQLDGDGDGKISKSELEGALGAGGTNNAAADRVFDKMDADKDGTISLSEMSSALKGRHRGHAHRPDPQAADPLLQALDSISDATKASAPSTAATTSYAFMQRALQSQVQAIARNATPAFALSV